MEKTPKKLTNLVQKYVKGHPGLSVSEIRRLEVMGIKETDTKRLREQLKQAKKGSKQV